MGLPTFIIDDVMGWSVAMAMYCYDGCVAWQMLFSRANIARNYSLTTLFCFNLHIWSGLCDFHLPRCDSLVWMNEWMSECWNAHYAIDFCQIVTMWHMNSCWRPPHNLLLWVHAPHSISTLFCVLLRAIIINEIQQQILILPLWLFKFDSWLFKEKSMLACNSIMEVIEGVSVLISITSIVCNLSARCLSYGHSAILLLIKTATLILCHRLTWILALVCLIYQYLSIIGFWPRSNERWRCQMRRQKLSPFNSSLIVRP